MQRFNRIACIVNPFAGGEKSIPSKVKLCLEKLTSAFSYCLIIDTDLPGREYACVQMAIAADTDCAIVFGGDGTLHKVINAYMELSPEKLPHFVIFPSGSGNDFARILNTSSRPVEFLTLVKYGKSRSIDMGNIDFPTKRKYFINCVGMGLDAEVVRRVNSAENHSSISYLKSIGTALMTYKFPLMNITLQDVYLMDKLQMKSAPQKEITITGEGTFAMVCNGEYAGSSMHFAPLAQPDDGYFDLIFVKKVNKALILAHLPSLYLGKHIYSPWVKYYRARSFTYNSPDVLLQADGELVGKAHCTISPAEKRLNFIVG